MVFNPVKKPEAKGGKGSSAKAGGRAEDTGFGRMDNLVGAGGTDWGKGTGMEPILPERRDLTLRGRWRRLAYDGKRPETWWQVLRIFLLLGLVALGYQAWLYREPVGAWMETRIANATGATVEKIIIEGAGHTRREDLQAALELKRGQSLVTYNTLAARERLEKMPWVRLAAVERQLPDTLKVSLFEHVPLARVEVDGQYWIANKDGVLITTDESEEFAGLPLLHGLGAPKVAAKLFATLAVWPNLMGQLKEATWVGQRRWDLLFSSGVTVRLPEEGPVDNAGAGGGDDEDRNDAVQLALRKLAELEQQRHVLTLPDGEVDLRMPDRIVLRLPADVGATPVTTPTAAVVSGTAAATGATPGVAPGVTPGSATPVRTPVAGQ